MSFINIITKQIIYNGKHKLLNKHHHLSLKYVKSHSNKKCALPIFGHLFNHNQQQSMRYMSTTTFDDDDNSNKVEGDEENSSTVDAEEAGDANNNNTYDETTPVDDLLQKWEDARSEQDYETSDAIRTFLKDTHGIRAASHEQDKEKQFVNEKVRQYERERIEYNKKKKLGIASFRERVNQQLSARKQRLDNQKSKKKEKKKVELPWQQGDARKHGGKARRTTMPNTKHRTKALSIQSKRRIIVQEEALNWITNEDDIDKPRVTINSTKRSSVRRASKMFTLGVTNRTPKTTFFNIANDFKLNMEIVDWKPDKSYSPPSEVLKGIATNPNLQRLNRMKLQATMGGKAVNTTLDDGSKNAGDKSSLSDVERGRQMIRYEYDFENPYDLMEFVEDQIPGVITVKVRGKSKNVSRVAGIFHFMEEVNRLTQLSREDFASAATLESLRELVVASVMEIKRLRKRHESLDVDDVSDADLILAREMDKRLKTLFDLLKNSRWEYNTIFEELNELVEVIEVLDNEPSLVDMRIRIKGNEGDRFNNKKKQRERPHKSKRMGSFKRTFGEDRR
jgi:hypothetical protein